MSYTNFRNLNAVVFHPMDFVIGPKIYISTALTIINLYLGTHIIFLFVNKSHLLGSYSLIIGQILFRNVFICSFRCGVPSSCCKESYRMESGLIKIRCGFELQNKTVEVVKEKVINYMAKNIAMIVSAVLFTNQ